MLAETDTKGPVERKVESLEAGAGLGGMPTHEEEARDRFPTTSGDQVAQTQEGASPGGGNICVEEPDSGQPTAEHGANFQFAAELSLKGGDEHGVDDQLAAEQPWDPVDAEDQERLLVAYGRGERSSSMNAAAQETFDNLHFGDDN